MEGFILKNTKFILASGSPRRKELLENLDLEFEVIPSEIDEDMFEDWSYEDLVQTLSFEKATDVFYNYLDSNNITKHTLDSGALNNSICVIGCDTLVCIEIQDSTTDMNNLKALGKPKNQEDALNMLKLLNGKTHEVLTGLTIVGLIKNQENQEKNKPIEYFEEVLCNRTKVKFSEFKEEELREYIKTGEPMDKAGAYGIQGKGSYLVEHIEGDFYSVMGLPVNELYKLLKTYNFI